MRPFLLTIAICTSACAARYHSTVPTDALHAELSVLVARVSRDPTNVADWRALAIAHQKVGDLRLASDDALGALAEYRAELEIVEVLATHEPSSIETTRAVMVAHSNVGDARLALGDGDRALAEYRASLVALATLPAKAGDPQLEMQLARLHLRVGDALAATDNRPAAHAEYAAGLAVATPLTVADPKDVSARHLFAELRARAAHEARLEQLSRGQ